MSSYDYHNLKVKDGQLLVMFGTDHRPIKQSILNTSTALNGGFSSITYKECNKLVYQTIMVENKTWQLWENILLHI